MKSDGPDSGFIRKTMDIDGQTRGYVVYVPEGYTAEKEWPLIIRTQPLEVVINY